MSKNNNFQKQIGEQFPTASPKEQETLEQLFAFKKDIMDAMIAMFNEAENAEPSEIGERIQMVMEDWTSAKDFYVMPIFWQTMLEVVLTKCSIIANGKDYRAYYKSVADEYVKTLMQIYGKEFIEREINWFEKH